MEGILYPTLVMGGLGVIFGALLAFASEKFYVAVDERQSKIRAPTAAAAATPAATATPKPASAARPSPTNAPRAAQTSLLK